MKHVAILGCGPAGLMVAHAAKMSGWDFRIYSRKAKSQLFGAQYLHQPIPALSHGGPRIVTYQMRGSAQEYRRKVYGETWDGTVSPEDYPEPHAAWDLRQAYELMWFDYADEVVDVDLRDCWPGGMDKRSFPVNTYDADLVISTVPRTIWDDDPSHFESTFVWALGDGDYERVHMHRPDPFHVICDGTDNQPWYRVSNIFGYCTMEWPDSRDCPARGASRVSKPLRYSGTDSTGFIHLGRFGAWEKGVLTSDVFYEAMKVFARDAIE